jgi:hypothetical protein
VDETLKLTQKLPPDWDLLFIGGKPFTYFDNNFTLYEDSSSETLKRDLCRGAFGKGHSPLSTEGSRPISFQDEYWITKFIYNTHAYVINPNRVHHIAELMKPAADMPIDARFADFMERGLLNAYMPTREWCRSGPVKYEEPGKWHGYFHWRGEASMHPYLPDNKFLWHDMVKENCLF